MKWFFSEFHGHIIARAPDGTTYRVPDGNMNSALGTTMLNAMACALSKPNEEARQAIDGIAELEQEARLMRARMERLQLERDTIVQSIVSRLEQGFGATHAAPCMIRREYLKPES